MTKTKPARAVRRKRVFPEIQWSPEKKAQWQAEREAIYQRCKVTFDSLQPELIKTHYNWFIAVEPESGEYFIDRNQLTAAHIAHEKHPNAKLHVFRINETGVCGTI
ncbi:MAG: hypothetical protein F6J93_27050 [Oscillatoria sp. SIO1A7]|nr:hypothetical protein [Oscillatoria sp. SIO1A7]